LPPDRGARVPDEEVSLHGGMRAAAGAASLLAAVGLAGPCAAAPAEGEVLAALVTHRVVVMGERHGFAPGRALFGRIAAEAGRRFPGTVVGLEIPADRQPLLDRLGAGPVPPALLPRVIGTPSYRDLLLALGRQARGGGLRLVALDLPWGRRGDRDAFMASRVLRVLAEGAPRAVVLVGNLHALAAADRLGGRLRAAGVACFLVGTLPGEGSARWGGPGGGGYEALTARLRALLPPRLPPGRELDAVVSWAAPARKTARR